MLEASVGNTVNATSTCWICFSCGARRERAPLRSVCPACNTPRYTAGQRLAALVNLWLSALLPGSNEKQRSEAAGEKPQSYHYIVRGRRSCSLRKVRRWVAHWNDAHPELALTVEHVLGDEYQLNIEGLTLDDVAHYAATGRQAYLAAWVRLLREDSAQTTQKVS